MAKEKKKNTISKIDTSFIKAFEEFEEIEKHLWFGERRIREKRFPTDEEFEEAIKNRKNKKRLRAFWKSKKEMWRRLEVSPEGMVMG